LDGDQKRRQKRLKMNKKISLAGRWEGHPFQGSTLQ